LGRKLVIVVLTVIVVQAGERWCFNCVPNCCRYDRIPLVSEFNEASPER
jgi:hypothetical protein